MYKSLMLCLMVLLGSMGVTYAQDPTVGSQEDNACNEGGALAGKCDTAWAWVCGWYLARLASNTFTRGQVIYTCASVLPSLPLPVVDIPLTSNMLCLLMDIPTGGNGTFDLAVNDCNLATPIVGSVAVSSIGVGSTLYSSIGAITIYCNLTRPWSYSFFYTDSSGRSATVNLSGNCI